MPFIGEVRIFAGSSVPSGWALCDGQILPVTSYPDLYNVIGSRFGGNGTTTYALPDLRGRTPIGPGQGSGLSDRPLAEPGGAESHLLSTTEMPEHTHALRAATTNGTSDRPGGNVMSRTPSAIPHYGANADVNLAPGAIASSGAGQPHNNMQPYLTLRYLIALQGDVPLRP